MIMRTIRAKVGNANMYTNMYVISDEETKEGILIDCGAGIEKITEYIDGMNIKLKYVVLTHCHVDHISGIKAIRKEYPRAKIIINEGDKKGMTDSSINGSEVLGVEENYIDPDIVVKDGDVITFGNIKAEVIHTPGHTEGSMCLLINDALFSGDTLFRGTRGRTDLKTGSEREILWSIKEKLLKLDENVMVYPGHGIATIIKEEKKLYQE